MSWKYFTAVEGDGKQLRMAKKQAKELLDYLGLSERLEHKPPSFPAADSSGWPWPL